MTEVRLNDEKEQYQRILVKLTVTGRFVGLFVG